MTVAPGPDDHREGARRIAMFVHTRRSVAVRAARRLIRDLADAGVRVALPGAELEDLAIDHGGVEELDDQLGDTGPEARPYELVVVLGGDGTILRGAEWALVADIPLLGVNLGHVGFLAEAESSQVDELAGEIVARRYRVESRLTVEVEVSVAGTPVWRSFAVNEVSIEKAARERMIEVMVGVDGEPLSRWGCDGVLVATPTGSTAYAFSAGGPVMSPDLDAMLLLPLSAHALFARPLVLAPEHRIDIALLADDHNRGVVWCDGRRSFELAPGSTLRVGRGGHSLLLARLGSSSFTERLVRKFGLRVEGWRRPDVDVDGVEP